MREINDQMTAVGIIKTCYVGVINDARIVARQRCGGDGGGPHQWTLIDK
jgi:hypothetical protein